LPGKGDFEYSWLLPQQRYYFHREKKHGRNEEDGDGMSHGASFARLSVELFGMARQADTTLFHLHPSSAGVTLWLGLAGVAIAVYRARNQRKRSTRAALSLFALAFPFQAPGSGGTAHLTARAMSLELHGDALDRALALQVRDTVACSINGIVQALALALEFAGVG
jgi:hypothetical protein